MKSNSTITPNFKRKVKSILDISLIVIILLLGLILGLLIKQSEYEALLISILLLLYIVQYQFTKKWVDDSFVELAEMQAVDTSNATQKIMQVSNAQKSEIENYLNLFEKVIGTAENLTNALNNTKQNAQIVFDKSNQSLNFSQKEQASVKINIEKMNILKQKIQIIAGLILDLSEHTQQIGETIYLIEDIAEQTNMLALNAAVEAARAGEHGKGFSIVAGEIRKLADESKQATTKITSLIKNIQQATNSTVMATEEGAKEIDLGVNLADSISENVDLLINIISEVKVAAEKIYSDSEDQTAFSTSVNSVIGDINDGLKGSLKVIEEKIEDVNYLDKISSSFKENLG